VTTVTTINRGPITDRLITELKTQGLPVGDNSAPDDAYGWQGEPNRDGSTFIPWMAISAGVAQAGTGSFGDSASEWRVPYTVTYACVSREQLDWLADRMRAALVSISREVVVTETGNWRIQQIRCTSVGGSNRVGSTFPDYFTQADLFEVWLSKERT
jgi:hypothetical protein